MAWRWAWNNRHIRIDAINNFQDIRTIIDSNILSENIGKSLLSNLASNEVICQTNDTTKGFIKWQRVNQQTFVQNDDNVSGCVVQTLTI